VPTLLVVDDDAAIRSMFARVLKSIGDVEEAKDGAEALKMMGQKRYDVVLLDWNMPVIDGPAVLRALEKPGLNRQTPIIVVTADASERARVEALRQGAVFFLNKPVQIASLAIFVKMTLGKKRA
jgi:two-component system chemotaxis response regulator CheY